MMGKLSTKPRKGYEMGASDKAAAKWGTESAKGYRRDAYYTQASDKQGHSAKTTVKMPTNVAGEIHSLVASGKIPEYRTSVDFIRDAVIHRLHDLEGLVDDPSYSRRISMYVLHQDVMIKRQHREEYAEMMTAIEEEIQYLQNTRQGDKLRRYLVELLDNAEEAIPPEFLTDFTTRIRQALTIAGG